MADSVLLADDDPLSCEFMAEVLRDLDLDVTTVGDGERAIEALRRKPFDFVFTDLQMPRADGMKVLAEAKIRDLDRPVVMVTAHGTMNVAVQAMRSGADDILEKPVSPEDLSLSLTRVRERRRLLRENRFFRAQSVGSDMLVNSRAMAGIVDLVARVAPSKATVLISGESGTGKERVA
ncbi:MAG: sigma-54-dependent Fis family transcriptional regulator, partial [Planctomycetes bacterium]|nr:sigma-54-dependent Fis family transcriptional regulator [Planctomycetota bacterium]